MKHFGEMVLGGQVSFTSSPTDGTVFSFRLPLAPGSRRPA
jgi:signal transduction histidine kinase